MSNLGTADLIGCKEFQKISKNLGVLSVLLTFLKILWDSLWFFAYIIVFNITL